MLPGRQDEIRDHFRNCVDVRLGTVRKSALAERIRRSEAVQSAFWATSEAAARTSPDSILVGPFVQSLNEVIDIHAERLAVAVRNLVPVTILLTLFAITRLPVPRLPVPGRRFVVICMALPLNS